MATNPVKITDLTIRDGHQSLFATRMRTEDMEPIAPEMDKAGFYAMEVWGGATFDVMTRFLNEDPWDRVRTLKKLMPNTPLQMLLRGQNLVGYRNYADDVVTAFVHHAAEVGIDIFRVFDAVNDERNFETALKIIKECGKHAQLSLCYSLTQPKLGGPVYTIEYYVNKALTLQDMGADSLCVKDMAGLMAPDDAYSLIKALKKALKIPVNLHTHYTSGMASMTCLKAIEAGVDIIDTVLAPLALRSSHPAIEPMVVALQGTPRDTGLNLAHLSKLGDYFETVAPKYRDFLDTTKTAVIDTGVLIHQVPGGMTTNLVAQLREAKALDRIEEVYAELPKVRKELGYPPLVTPTSQIVGIQAVQNVLFGRYKMISGQVKDYVYGLYGRPPASVDPEVQKMVLKGYPRGETPTTSRAADILEPEMEVAKEATKGIARDIGDVLVYALYPTTGMRFLRWKYGLETPPPEVRAKTLEEVKHEDDLVAKAKAGKLTASEPPAATSDIRTFNIYLDDEVYSIGVQAVDASSTSAPHVPVESGEQKAPAAEAHETTILAPLPGIIVDYKVRVGDEIETDDVVAILEAMKMANNITTPIAGRVKALNVKPGDAVELGAVVAIIADHS